MSNVIAFAPVPRTDGPQSIARMLNGFARERRLGDDVFWLKENAELLGILAAGGVMVPQDALEPYQALYDGIEERLRFFPQYYRFLLSICLDLEDLGMPGNHAARLCRWAALEGVAEAELSDLQRAEARRLLARRDAAKPLDDDPLGARLRRFIARSTTFAMPNKKAAYELTHIVFYLSEYGRVDPQLDSAAIKSLEFAGVLAYLDQNFDLLAEVCTALRFAGRTPSRIWDEAVTDFHRQVEVASDPGAPMNDAYHAYLVTGWARLVAGQTAFEDVSAGADLRFVAPQPQPGALRSLSECLFDLGPVRNADWAQMRGHVMPYLGPDGHQVLYQAEQSISDFDVFFQGFARATAI